MPVLPAGFLYPILSWGPNNQVAGLKEALVLGRLLNRTVIVHNVRSQQHQSCGAAAWHTAVAPSRAGLVHESLSSANKKLSLWIADPEPLR